jgi:hypothetical protein
MVITYLNVSKLCFIRKFRPKRFYKIDSRVFQAEQQLIALQQL